MGSQTGAQVAFDSDIPVQTRTRATFLLALGMMTALLAFCSSAVCCSLGPLAIGTLRDAWQPSMDVEAIRYALLMPAVVLFLSAIAFWRAGWEATVDAERPRIEAARSRAALPDHGSTHACHRDTD